MSRERDRLVDEITRQVLAAMSGSATASPSVPADRREHDHATCDRCSAWGNGAVRGPDETRLLAAAGASRVVATMGYCPASDGLASVIDHTLLKPDATREEVEQLCREAAQFCFASLCVNPNWVALCREMLAQHGRQGVHGDRIPARRAPARREVVRADLSQNFECHSVQAAC